MIDDDLKELLSLNGFRIKILMELVDPDAKPFAYHVLEGVLSETQYMEVMDLMQCARAQKTYKQVKPP